MQMSFDPLFPLKHSLTEPFLGLNLLWAVNRFQRHIDFFSSSYHFDPKSTFLHNDGKMVNNSLSHSVHSFGSIWIRYASPLVCSGFFFSPLICHLFVAISCFRMSHEIFFKILKRGCYFFFLDGYCFKPFLNKFSVLKLSVGFYTEALSVLPERHTNKQTKHNRLPMQK